MGKAWSQRTKARIIKDNAAKSHNQKPCDSMDFFILKVKLGPMIIMLYGGGAKVRPYTWTPKTTVTRSERCMGHKYNL